MGATLASMPHVANRVKLTNARIRKLAHDPQGTGLQVVWDSDQPGLGLRLRARRKVFLVRYRDPAGVSRRANLGEWSEKERAGALTLKEARTQASARIHELANAGADPVQIVPKTLEDAFTKFMETREDHLSAWTVRDYKNRWRNHLAPACERQTKLGGRRLDRITGGDLEDLYTELRSMPTTANHVLRLFSTVWSYAAARGDMGIDAMTPNPTKMISKHSATRGGSDGGARARRSWRRSCATWRRQRRTGDSSRTKPLDCFSCRIRC